jgi:DNA-binding protein H-NS
MTISLQKLLLKMEEELILAKRAESEATQRERIQAIKTLCELVLDEPITTRSPHTSYNPAPRQEHRVPQPIPAQPLYAVPAPGIQPAQQPSPMIPQPKKLEMEDSSNGDSLFDF